MTFAQYTNDTEASRTRGDACDGGGRVPLKHPLVSKEDLAAMSTKDKDGSLSAVVRQWLRTTEALERQARPEGDNSPLRPTWTPPREDLVDAAETPSLPLPRRRRLPTLRPTRRLAVLIDAGSTSAESADSLFEALSDQGTVSVCRAYADWTSPDARDWWSAPLREHAIQPYHHFGDEEDQRALVALTIDAVDLAHASAVDTLVIVGDLASLHPLIIRLNASGIQVIAVGTTPTPQDVRELCHEFVDLSGKPDTDNTGKHRA